MTGNQGDMPASLILRLGALPQTSCAPSGYFPVLRARISKLAASTRYL